PSPYTTRFRSEPDVLVLHHHEMRRPRPDLLLASGAPIGLALLPGRRLDPHAFRGRPLRSHPARPLGGLQGSFPLPRRPTLPGHYATTSRMNEAATSPRSRPISSSGRFRPRTRNAWSPPSTTCSLARGPSRPTPAWLS